MKIRLLMIPLVTTLLLSSCCEPKIEYRYIKVPCPKLKTWKVEPLGDIEYTVKNGSYK